jgi:hypothetical protein
MTPKKLNQFIHIIPSPEWPPTVCGLSRMLLAGYLRVGGRGQCLPAPRRTCTCGTGAGRHRWEQEKLEARKMLACTVRKHRRKCRRLGERASSEHRSSSLTGSPSQSALALDNPTRQAARPAKQSGDGVHALLACFWTGKGLCFSADNLK